MGEEPFVLEWEQVETPDDFLRSYMFRGGPISGARVRLAFEGLLPSPLDESELNQMPEEFSRALDSIRWSFDAVRYLGPFRDRPLRLNRLPTRRPKTVGSSGEDTAAVLINDFVRGGRLLREVDEELDAQLEGWSIDVVGRGELYALVLRSRAEPHLTVNIADAGSGIAQALPVFVQRALDASRRQGPTLEVVERPDFHLHPQAHAALAELYLRAAEQGPTRFLVETHSETMLLRVRRRIAERQVSPDLVAVYFVENDGGTAKVKRVNIDADGNLDYWPEGVFSEDYEEARGLAKAQLDRLASNNAAWGGAPAVCAALAVGSGSS